MTIKLCVHCHQEENSGRQTLIVFVFWFMFCLSSLPTSTKLLTKVNAATQDKILTSTIYKYIVIQRPEYSGRRTVQMVTGYNRLILNPGRQERDKRPYILCPVQQTTKCVCPALAPTYKTIQQLRLEVSVCHWQVTTEPSAPCRDRQLKPEITKCTESEKDNSEANSTKLESAFH